MISKWTSPVRILTCLLGAAALLTASGGQPLEGTAAASFEGDFQNGLGVCADTASTCAVDDDCEGTCTVTSHECIADADCPTGLCSGTSAVCGVPEDCQAGACSITTATSCHFGSRLPAGDLLDKRWALRHRHGLSARCVLRKWGGVLVGRSMSDWYVYGDL